MSFLCKNIDITNKLPQLATGGNPNKDTMKYEQEDSVIASLQQEISRLNSLVFEKSFDCEMFKIKLNQAEDTANMWERMYFSAINGWSESQDNVNKPMRCK